MRVYINSFLLFILLFSVKAYAQIPNEYTLNVSAKISNQGSKLKPAFRDEREYPTRIVNTLYNFKVDKNVKLSKYGGRMDKKTNATGFFYVKQIDGRWWAVDPEGYLFIHKGINSVTIGQSENNKKAFQVHFTGVQDWAAKTNLLLNDLGFNGTGAWSNVEQLKKVTEPSTLAYTVMLNFMGSYGRKNGAYQKSGHLGYPDNTIFVFDPEFEKHCNEYAKQIIPYKNEKALFGYFSDNEMPFYKNTLDNYLSKKDTTDAGYLAARNWIKERNIAKANITDQDRHDFLGFVADRYFSIVSKAIRKYDPNHLYIGCRFHSYEKNVKQVFTAAGKYLDVISINYYNQWTPKAEDMQNWEQWSGKPFIITEWYTKGEDSGMANFSGAGWIVKTQKDRGYFYQNYALALLESGNCIGWHWFKYMDNDPSRKDVDPSNVDANKGIVDNNYSLYKDLTNKMKELNDVAYQLADFFDNRKAKSLK